MVSSLKHKKLDGYESLVATEISKPLCKCIRGSQEAHKISSIVSVGVVVELRSVGEALNEPVPSLLHQTVSHDSVHWPAEPSGLSS